MTAITAEAIPKLCLLEQCPGISGFHSFCIGEHFLPSASLILTKFVSNTWNDKIAYFGDEKDGIDCIVEYVGPDESLHSAMKSSVPTHHKYTNILQENRNLDCDYDWTIDG